MYYTDTLNENVRQSVRRITGGTLSALRSDIFAGAVDRELVWREARKDPTTQTWTVTHCQAYPQPAAPDKLFVETIHTHGLCFFDALYQVVRIEAEGDLLGLKERVENTPDFITAPHHRAKAEMVGIPYDPDGLPVPAVDGAIVVAGRYEPEALKIAARSQGNCPHSAPENISFNALVPARATPAYPTLATGKDFTLSAHFEKKRKDYVRLFKGEAGRVDSRNRPWGESNRFVGGMFLGAGSSAAAALTLLLSASAPAIIGLPLLFSGALVGAGMGGYVATQHIGDYFAKKRWKKIKNIAEKFPEGHETRRSIERFHDEALLGYYVLKAKNVFNVASSGGFIAKRRLKSTFRQLDKAFDRVSLAADERLRLLAEITNGKDDGFFYRLNSHLENRGKDIAHLLEQSDIRQIEQAGMKPR